MATLATFVGVLMLLGGAVLLPHSLPVLLALGLVYGWMLFTYLQYRWGRQEELRQLLITAVEGQAPLAPALKAYVRDRPHGPLREFWVALLLFFVVPGYYWLWHRRRSFDARLARLADLMDVGYSLYEGLELVPGVASRQTVLAAAVGGATGRLAVALRGTPQSRFQLAVLESLPRLFYPVLLLLFMNGLLTAWVIFQLPKFERIAADFHIRLPAATQHLAALGRGTFNTPVLTFLAAVLVVAALTAVLTGSSTARWYFPGFGSAYRMDIQGTALKMLAVLLEAGKPLPEALGLLAAEHVLPTVAARRVEKARLAVLGGEAFPAALRRGALLPSAMVPLVEAAERSGRLPWALNELGEHLAGRAARRIKRLTLLVFPTCILGVGLVGGYLALGMFLPLIDFIWSFIP